MNLALMELKIMAAKIVGAFHVHVFPDQTVTYANSLRFAMKHPFMVKLEARTPGFDRVARSC